MNVSATRPLLLFLIGVIFVERTSLTLVKTVSSGATVSLLCSNIVKENSYVSWFKSTNDSLPLCIVTKFISKTPSDFIYLNGFKKNQMEMTVNDTFSSLKIFSVNVSDSGLFYCGSFLGNYMMFHNKTLLVVLNVNQSKEDFTNKSCGTNAETLRSCHVYYTLTMILSGLVLLSTLISIVVLIKWKKRKQKEDGHRRGNNEEMNKPLPYKEQDEDLNYTALRFKKKSRPVRAMRNVEPNVVYAATR